MPFGKKTDPSRPGQPDIDFNRIYDRAIEPAVRDAGLEPVRADKEVTGGVIHKPMFERLLLCDFAVADLTTANPNVYYELGVRHTARHNTTLPIFAGHVKLPFDVAIVRGMPYQLQPNNGFGDLEAANLRESLGARLKELRELARTGDATDSPVFQLVSKSQQSNLPKDARLARIKSADASLYELLNQYSGHEKTDIIRDRLDYSEKKKRQLAAARHKEKSRDDAVSELKAVHEEIRPLDGVEAGVVVDLYLSYRAVGAWEEMLQLFDEMPLVLKRSVLVREQKAFALNRLAPKGHPEYRDEALGLLNEVAAEAGPSSETFGLMGRVYKDLWQAALNKHLEDEAEGYLKQAIDAYVRGFTADSRDAYPGINALTLLDIEGSAPSLARKDELLPVVRFAVQQRICAGEPDYWDYATLLEIEVLAGNRSKAQEHLSAALSRVREKWEPGTTADNLSYIHQGRAARGAAADWVAGVIATLRARAA
jgi:hypothetical protein